jgi:rhodanese-related sulfurtransferase
MLMDHGYVRVRPLLGGLDAWADAGYQLDTFALVKVEAAG